MVALRFGLLLLASAITAQACTYCQCLFSDSSHCCVYSVRIHLPPSPFLLHACSSFSWYFFLLSWKREGEKKRTTKHSRTLPLPILTARKRIYLCTRTILTENTLQDAKQGNLDCTAICAGAKRADGTSNADGTAGTACAASGSYKCAGVLAAQGRTPCYKQ